MTELEKLRGIGLWSIISGFLLGIAFTVLAQLKTGALPLRFDIVLMSVVPLIAGFICLLIAIGKAEGW